MATKKHGALKVERISSDFFFSLFFFVGVFICSAVTVYVSVEDKGIKFYCETEKEYSKRLLHT